MSAYDLILLAGAQHSQSNAQKLRAWRDECNILRGNFHAFVDDYKRRGFLTAEDAQKLKEGSS